MDPQTMMMAIVFVAVTGIVGAVAFFVRQVAGAKTLDDRLERLAVQKTPTLQKAGIIKGEGLFPTDTQSFVERMLPQLPSLSKLFEQAEFNMTPANFWMLTLGVAAGGGFIVYLINMPLWASVFGALIASALPLFYVMHLRKRRLRKFASQLCEALELVARALRAGHSLAAGMHVVAEEMPNPVASEFHRVWEEQNLGVSIEDAMRNLSDRIPNLDLKFFVNAVIIQRSTGGDLAEILDKIGHVIRERFKIMGMVQALTGEGRISGIVLIALPFGLLLLLLAISPNYVSMLWTDPRGVKMSIFGIVMMILGALWIRKIIDIKI